MKKLSKVLVLVLSVIMVFAMSASVFADTQDSGKGGPASITITLPTTETAPTAATTYKIYKVFDATTPTDGSSISYRLVDGKTTVPAGFEVDGAGNVVYTANKGKKPGDEGFVEDLTADDIAAIAGYVGNSDLIYTATVAKGETEVTVTGLPYGYYYITTSTGTVVTVDSTRPDAEVEDKNVIPKVEKSAGTEYDEDSLKAIAAVGTDQPFTAVITKTKGATNLVFTDTMTNMTYNADVVVTVGGATVSPGTNTFTVTGAQGDSSFSVAFNNNYIAGLTDGTEITLNYSGKITSDALSTNPAKNKATLTSGDGNIYESEEVKVYNAKFTVTKQDGSNKPLAGAGFVIKNADGKYYKLAADKKSISWVDNIDDATEYTSDAQGAVPAFTGLGSGTYTLHEKTVPDGYNAAADSTFEISENDYTAANLEQTATVKNEAGTELPATGGIGTTIFYILGSLLVVGCGIVLVSRKRMQNNK